MRSDRRDGTGRPGRGTRILLAVSLALNLLVLGLLVGALLRGGLGGHPGDPRAPASLRALGATPFLLALDEADRDRLLADARGRGEDLRANRAALRDGVDAMVRTLRSEPFDAGTFRRLAADQRRAAAARQALGEDLLLARIEAMSPEARMAYADRLERIFRRRPPRQHR